MADGRSANENNSFFTFDSLRKSLIGSDLKPMPEHSISPLIENGVAGCLPEEAIPTKLSRRVPKTPTTAAGREFFNTIRGAAGVPIEPAHRDEIVPEEHLPRAGENPTPPNASPPPIVKKPRGGSSSPVKTRTPVKALFDPSTFKLGIEQRKREDETGPWTCTSCYTENDRVNRLTCSSCFNVQPKYAQAEDANMTSPDVLYIAIFFELDVVVRLRRRIRQCAKMQRLLPSLKDGHVNLSFRPSNGLVQALTEEFGAVKVVRIIGMVDEPDCQAFLVDIVEEKLRNLKKPWEFPYITVSMGPGVSPVKANQYIQMGKVTRFEKDKIVEVNGFLGTCVSSGDQCYRVPDGPFE